MGRVRCRIISAALRRAVRGRLSSSGTLEEMVSLSGTAVIKGGYLVPSDAPGFGIEVGKEWLERAAVR